MVDIGGSSAEARTSSQMCASSSSERMQQAATFTKNLDAALAAKQGLISGLEESLMKARHQTSAYEAR